MAKVSKTFRLSDTAIACIDLLKNEGKYTETEVIEQSLLNYVYRVFGQEKMNELVLRAPYDKE